jgi:heat shock protein HtpX
MIGTPLAGLLLRSMISRVREYAADTGGSKISGKPLGLANALQKISAGANRIPVQRGDPTHAHLFIINPFTGGLQRLFSTHPPVEERIRRLRILARAAVNPQSRRIQ